MIDKNEVTTEATEEALRGVLNAVVNSKMPNNEKEFLEITEMLFRRELEWIKENNKVRFLWMLSEGICVTTMYVKNVLRLEVFEEDILKRAEISNYALKISKAIKTAVEDHNRHVFPDYDELLFCDRDIVDLNVLYLNADMGLSHNKTIAQNMRSIEDRLEFISKIKKTL